MSYNTLAFKQALTGQDFHVDGYLEKQSSTERYASSEVKYRIFCCLWAIVSLFHMANQNTFTLKLNFFLFTISAIALLVKPSSLVRLLVFISMQLFQATLDLPGISNHWILVTFVNLTILHVYLYLILKHRSFHIDRVEFLNTFSPLVRIELLTLYFFVVFHKLNAGFFDTNDSCAVRFLILQTDYYHIPLSKTFLTFNIYLTLIIEALIPLLFVFRRTRNWGILLGLIFHCILAYNPLNGFFDFSAAVFALYFLFTSASFSHKINSFYKGLFSSKKSFQSRLGQFSITKLVLLVVASVFVLGFIYALVFLYTKSFNNYFRDIVWTAFSGLFIIVFAISMFSKGKEQEPKTFSFAHYSLLVFPLIVFLNGLCPYLGLKTESSYAMFSNLRTEGGVTNHFFVPVSTQIFDYQKDLVEVVSSTDPYLKEVAAEHKLMPFFQFRRHVRKIGVKQVTYLRNGETKTFDKATASWNSELLQKSSYPLEKILQFRAFNKYGEPDCGH